MTNEQKAEARLMILKGASCREVGEKYGVSHQYIQQLFPGMSRRGRRCRTIYPNIQKWINDNCGTRQRFAKMIGTCATTCGMYLAGSRTPDKKMIDKILEVTGMTYEEAFKQ